MRRWWPWPVLLVAVLVPRILLLWRFRGALIESDEAVIGLMARHLLSGEWTVFYWGQHYLGSLEAILAAVPVWVFGTSPLILKLVPLVLFLGFLVLHQRLAREILPRSSAFWATALVGCSPAFLMIWSMKTRGYMPVFLLGTAALLVTARLLRDPDRSSLYLWLGLLLGIGWWAQFLVIVYLLPIAVALLLLDERRVVRHLHLLAPAFFLGSLPFWIYNLHYRWASLEVAGAAGSEAYKDLIDFFKVGLPILVGARPNWGDRDLFPLASLLFVGVPVLCALLVSRQVLKQDRTKPHDARGLMVLFALGFPLILSCSGFAWFMREPRYLIPLYSVLYILFVAGLDSLGSPGRRALPFLASFWIGFHLLTTWWVTNEEFTGYTNTEAMGPLISFLEERGVTHAMASYWVAYRLSYESGERIIATPARDDTLRYEPYWKAVSKANRIAYIRLEGPVYSQITRQLDPPPDYAPTRVGKFVVFLPPTGAH
ncbi:MAG: glycosyltransferase family 39 protein [Acidobacteriota bacterium]